MLKNDKDGLRGIDVGGEQGEIRFSGYADDSVIITDGSERSLKRAMVIVAEFCAGTGLVINEAKTEGLMLGTMRACEEPPSSGG